MVCFNHYKFHMKNRILGLWTYMFHCSWPKVIFFNLTSISNHDMHCCRNLLHISFTSPPSSYLITISHFNSSRVASTSSINVHCRSDFIASPLRNTFVTKLFYHYIPPDHDGIGDWHHVWFQFTHESAPWIYPASHTSMRLETITNTSPNTHQYHITITTPTMSMLFSTIFPIEALPNTSCYNGTAMADAGHAHPSSNWQAFQPTYGLASYSRHSRYILPFHYTHHFRHHIQFLRFSFFFPISVWAFSLR